MHIRDNEIIAALLMLSVIAMAAWQSRRSILSASSNRRVAMRDLVIISIMLTHALLLVLLSSDTLFREPFLDVAVIDSIVALVFLVFLATLAAIALTTINPLAKLRNRVSIPPQLVVASLITILFWVSALSQLESTDSQHATDTSLPPILTIATAHKTASEDLEPRESTSVPEYEDDSDIQIADGWSFIAVTEPNTYQSPSAMTIDKDGNIWVSDDEGLHLFKLDSQSSQLITTDFQNSRGLTFLGDRLFITHKGRLIELYPSNFERQNILVTDLPHELYPAHSANGLIAINEHQLLFGLGGTSDHGPEIHEFAGSIMLYDLNSSELRQYASGFRNPYDLTMCTNGDVYVSDNGPDSVDETLTYRPPDELNLLKIGANYGYPTYFGYPPPWSDSEAPVALFGMSSAAAGILCDDNKIFVTLWGSLVIPEQTGKKIVTWGPIADSHENSGIVSDFAVGNGIGRPVDIVKSSNSIYWLDWEHGQLFKATSN